MTINMTPAEVVCGQCGEGNFITTPEAAQGVNTLFMCTVCHVEVRGGDLELDENDIVLLKPVAGHDKEGNVLHALMLGVLSLVIEDQDLSEFIDSAPPIDSLNGGTVTTQTTETEETETPTPTLTKRDRCDRCTAAAYVLVEVKENHLQFCGHHYATHEAVLAGLGVKVLVDNRAELLVRS